MKKSKKTLNFPSDFFIPDRRTLPKRRLLHLGTLRDFKLPTIQIPELSKHRQSPSYSHNPEEEEVELTASFRPIHEDFSTTLARERDECDSSTVLMSYLSPSFSVAMSPVLLSPIMSPRSTEAKCHLPHLKPQIHNKSPRNAKGNLNFSKESPRLPSLETPLKSMNVTFSIPRNREVVLRPKPYSM